LLELLLALGLSIVVLIGVGMAISIYLRLFDSSREKIEEAQLARILLRRMSDDIRGAVVRNSVDATNLVSQTTLSAASTGETASTATGDASSISQLTSQLSESQTTTDTSSTTTTVDDSTDLSTASPQTVPGLYGNSTQLEIDLSRLPRIDQYLTVANQDNSIANQNVGTSESDHLSDLRNVSYFVSNVTASNSVAGNVGNTGIAGNTGSQTGYGLYRRDRDRASVLYASQNGIADDSNTLGDLIAPEVESLQFAYYDGTQWLTSWDSTQNGGLPVAVQITLAITRPPNKYGVIPSPGMYSLLVTILTDQTANAASSSSDSSSTDSSSDASSSASGGSQSSSTGNTQQNTQNSNSGQGGQQNSSEGKR
jgi:hypothetical protein